MSAKSLHRRLKRSFETKVQLALWKGKHDIAPVSARAEGSKKNFEFNATLACRLKTPRTHADAEKLDKNLSPPPPGFYIIVGCGAAAVVNHTTLRQSAWGNKRIGSLPVVHVGFEDPWLHFHDHKMGQLAQLLQLPGYHYDPFRNGETMGEPRSAKRFAADTQKEWRWLAEKHPFGVIRAWVAAIQPRGVAGLHAASKRSLEEMNVDLSPLESEYKDDWPPYRLLVVTPEGASKLTYAHKIDLCTGSGRPNVSFYGRDHNVTNTYGARCWEPPESWEALKSSGRQLATRSIMPGTEALYGETKWESKKRICVMGAGGVSVNMVEVAEETEGVAVDWMAGDQHKPSFDNPRNDPLLRDTPGSTERLGIDGFRARRAEVARDLIPWDTLLRIGQKIILEKDSVTEAGGTVTARFVENSAPTVAGVRFGVQDCTGDRTVPAAGVFPYSASYKLAIAQALGVGVDQAPPPGTYHRLIACTGQDWRAEGHPERLLSKIEATNFGKDVVDTRFVALLAKGPTGNIADAQKASIRVLGVALTTNAQWLASLDGTLTLQNDRENLESWRKDMPKVAIAGGFTFNCLNIAYANRYFGPGGQESNTNANVASEAELTDAKMLGDAQLARAVIRARQASLSGFATSADLVTAIRALTNPVPALASGWEAAVLRLKCTYPQPAPDS